MTYYVSANTDMTGDGSKRRPFKTIQEAADIAGPGDTILVADGIYREHVHPVNSGTIDRPIIYRAIHPRRAVITGAELLSDWVMTGDTTLAGHPIYQTRIPLCPTESEDPFLTLLAGDWIHLSAPLHTAMLFLDEEALQEVEDRDHIVQETASWILPSDEVPAPAGFWCAQKERDGIRITAVFGGKDPAGHVVEAAVRKNGFMPIKNGIDYITLDGFVCTRYATQWAPPTAYQDGAVGPHWAKGWTIKNCEISWSRCSGISLGKYYNKNNDNKWTYDHRKHGTQNERDTVCQAVNDGWSRESAGSHKVIGCDIHDCGQAGIVGHLGAVFSEIEDNHIHCIGIRREFGGAEIAGIKLHAAIDVTLKHNHIHHCIRGLWLDWQAQGTRVSANLFHDNMPYDEKSETPAAGEDLFIEVSHGPTLVDNNVFLSAHAVRIAAQGIAFVHNLIAGAFTCVGEGTDNKAVNFPSERYTPYHVPHSTAIAGFMTILHGDMRFYNNLFVQHFPEGIVGTKPYDGYPSPDEYFAALDAQNAQSEDRDLYYDHLPVTSAGNVYLGGARPCDREQEPVCIDEKVLLKLEEEEEGLYLVTDLYRHVNSRSCSLIGTDILGEAFEPDQRFEASDGTELIIHLDHHGRHRGLNPMCGPFEVDGEQFVRLLMIRRMKNIAADEETSFVPDVEETPADIRADIQPKRKADQCPDPEEILPDPVEEAGGRVDANLVLINCEACTFPLSGVSFTVREVYVRGNEVWMRSVENPAEAVHMDCEYGIQKRIPVGTFRAPFSLDVSEDRNLLGIVNTMATMFRILSKSMVQDPEVVCERIRDKANETLEAAGITMRFTPKLLKFIRAKKFITLEEVIDTVASPDQEIVAEILDD